ncbi:MAG: ribosome small subunit-dependent GTPase A [Defluviitaleaceae bacterium]|nr:ribosome small subunit-dependent GTPase A [Defluviitaleaceae bacterium]
MTDFKFNARSAVDAAISDFAADTALPETARTGRIARGVGGNYYVLLGKEEYACAARGLFRKQGIEPLVGDFVELINIDDAKKTAFINAILPRKNSLVRPKASNIDIVAIVCAVSPRPNFDLIDAMLITCEIQSLKAIIVINKIDMLDCEISNSDINLLKGYETAGYQVVSVSAKESMNLEDLRMHFYGGVNILAGASGVGKSSIINALYPGVNLEIGELSTKIARGKHTTRTTQLIPLCDSDNCGFIVDSPGFSSLNIDNIPKSELQNYYREFLEYKENCYYVNCLHISEHDCAVKEQLGINIDYGRYERYIRYVTKDAAR